MFYLVLHRKNSYKIISFLQCVTESIDEKQTHIFILFVSLGYNCLFEKIINII